MLHVPARFSARGVWGRLIVESLAWWNKRDLRTPPYGSAPPDRLVPGLRPAPPHTTLVCARVLLPA